MWLRDAIRQLPASAIGWVKAMKSNMTSASERARYFKRLLRFPVRIAWKAFRYFALLISPLVIGLITSKKKRIRHLIFDAMYQSKKFDHLYVRGTSEKFLVNIGDNTISREIFTTGECDFSKFSVAIDLLARNNVIVGKLDLLVDVGANIGAICIPAVTRGYTNNVLAIEPHPSNCHLLRTNICLNSKEKEILVRELAVGEFDNASLLLEVSNDNSGDHRIFVGDSSDGLYGESKRKKITVQSCTLDSIVEHKKWQKLLIWMDVQGYEGFVLKGAKKLIKEKVPLVIEFWPYGMKRAGSYASLRDMLAHYKGYYNLETPCDLYPIYKLDELYSQLGEGGRFTDLLLI